jgi:hypothetical protein
VLAKWKVKWKSEKWKLCLWYHYIIKTSLLVGAEGIMISMKTSLKVPTPQGIVGTYVCFHYIKKARSCEQAF